MNRDDIYEVLEKAQFRSTVLEVLFLDASRTRDVRKLDNTVVATYKKVIGLYLAEEPDQIYGITHLLLEDLSDGTLDRPTVYSIPVPIIMKIRNINDKPTKTMSGIGFPILAGKQVKVSQGADGVGDEVKPNE